MKRTLAGYNKLGQPKVTHSNPSNAVASRLEVISDDATGNKKKNKKKKTNDGEAVVDDRRAAAPSNLTAIVAKSHKPKVTSSNSSNAVASSCLELFSDDAAGKTTKNDEEADADDRRAAAPSNLTVIAVKPKRSVTWNVQLVTVRSFTKYINEEEDGEPLTSNEAEAVVVAAVDANKLPTSHSTVNEAKAVAVSQSLLGDVVGSKKAKAVAVTNEAKAVAVAVAVSKSEKVRIFRRQKRFLLPQLTKLRGTTRW
jgi:hypothetical protein